jgi:flagellar biosynthetic protein FliR
LIPTVLATAAFVFFRVSGLIGIIPVFGMASAPRHVTVILALSVTAILVPVVPPAGPSDLTQLFVGLLCEYGLGALAGGVVLITFSALAVAMELAGHQIGLGMASLFDPITRTQESALGSLASWMAGLVFIGAGLHTRCLEQIATSFFEVPPGMAVMPSASPAQLLQLLTDSLSLGIQLAGPFVIGGFLFHALIAVLSRLAPRMNAFFSIGMTATSLFGLWLFMLSLPWMLVEHSAAVEAAVGAIARWTGG